MNKPNLIELDGKVFGCGVWVKNWDVVFESLINKDFDIIQKISDSYIKEWNSQFEVARAKILKAKSLGFNYEHETYPKLLQESQYNLSINNFIINILSIYNYWLIKDTCLSIVKYNKIPSNILQIAVTNIKDKVNILQLASKYNIKIEVQVEPQRELKDFGFGEILFKVPYPVMDYLTKYTGKSWKELDTTQ
jgi:hypothetical protein